MKHGKVCVIIPAYNESVAIGGVVKAMHEALSHSGFNGEIIVVDDGSIDGTSAVAKKAGATVIKHILNSGAGAATATGLSFAEHKGYVLAATMDADGQHLPKDVIEGFKVMSASGDDLLIGSRLIDSDGMSKVKVLGNKGLSLITYVLFGINSTDSQSGLRIFSKRSLTELRWKTSGYEFCSEMLWRAKQLRLSVNEYPISAIYTEYSKSKGQSNWNAVNIVRSLLARRIMELFG